MGGSMFVVGIVVAMASSGCLRFLLFIFDTAVRGESCDLNYADDLHWLMMAKD